MRRLGAVGGDDAAAVAVDDAAGGSRRRACAWSASGPSGCRRCSTVQKRSNAAAPPMRHSIRLSGSPGARRGGAVGRLRGRLARRAAGGEPAGSERQAGRSSWPPSYHFRRSASSRRASSSPPISASKRRSCPASLRTPVGGAGGSPRLSAARLSRVIGEDRGGDASAPPRDRASSTRPIRTASAPSIALGGEQQPRRLARPDQRDQPVHVLLRIGDADLGRGDREARAAAGDAQVAGHGERDAGAVAGPVDRGEVGMARSRSASSAARMRSRKRRGRLVAAHRREIAEVGAGAEGVARAGDDQQPRALAPRPRRAARPSSAQPAAGMALRASGRSRVRRAIVAVVVEAEHGARHAAAPAALSRKKRPGRPIRGGPAIVVPRRPVRWRRGAAGECRREHSRASTRRRDHRARAVPERNPAASDG